MLESHNQNTVLEDQQDHCINCEQKFINTDFVYCPKCGQHTQDRLTMGLLFRNTIASYFSLDSRLLTSLLPLLFVPGKVALEFIEGKRLTYLHPSQAYVMYSIIFFFIFSFYSNTWVLPEITSEGLKFETNKALSSDSIPTKDVEIQPLDSLNQEIKNNEGLSRLDSLIALGMTNEEIIKTEKWNSITPIDYLLSKGLDIYRDNATGLLPTVLAQIPLAIFLLVPIYAFILWIVNIRRKKTYAENLVHALYLFSFVFFTLSVILALIWLTKNNEWLVLYGIIPPIYFLLSFKKFYKQKFFKSFIKLILVSLLFSIIIIPVAFALTAVLTFLFY